MLQLPINAAMLVTLRSKLLALPVAVRSQLTALGDAT